MSHRVANIALPVGVAGGETDGILADEPAQGGGAAQQRQRNLPRRVARLSIAKSPLLIPQTWFHPRQGRSQISPTTVVGDRLGLARREMPT